jgi:non-ribosomal peptide synthase protein (TIGR01720 family)
VFNYLGQLDAVLPASSLFAPAPESGGPARSPRQRRAHLLEINGAVSGGRLRLTWTYSKALHCRRTIETLADSYLSALRELIEHCRSNESGGFTPSDFPEARVNQEDLDKLMARVGKRKLHVR